MRTDHPANVVGLLDAAGQVVNEYEYDPWGVATRQASRTEVSKTLIAIRVASEVTAAMMTLQTLLIGVLAMVVACTPTQQNSGSTSGEQIRQSAESADTSVAALLGAHGCRLDSVMVDRGSHLAVLGRRASDDAVQCSRCAAPVPLCVFLALRNR